MPRTAVPDSRKLRTVPVRITKPVYRTLLAILEISGISIQEQLRRAIDQHVAQMREQLADLQIEFPHELVMAQWTDPEFDRWLARDGKLMRGKTATKEAEAAAAQPIKRRFGKKQPEAIAS